MIKMETKCAKGVIIVRLAYTKRSTDLIRTVINETAVALSSEMPLLNRRANRRYTTLRPGLWDHIILHRANIGLRKFKMQVLVCETSKSMLNSLRSTSNENSYTAHPFTNLLLHENFLLKNTNMKLLIVFLMLAFGSSLAAVSCSRRHLPVTGDLQRPPRKVADKEAGPLERRAKCSLVILSTNV